jgi:hypothetical protein
MIKKLHLEMLNPRKYFNDELKNRATLFNYIDGSTKLGN